MLVHKLWSRWWVGCECEGEGWVWSHRGVRALKRRLSDTKINFQNYRTQHLYKGQASHSINQISDITLHFGILIFLIL